MAKKILVLSTLSLLCFLSACSSKVTPQTNTTLDLPVYDSLTDTKNTLTALEAGGYSITVQPVGNMPPEAWAAVNAAAQRWQGVITDGLSDISGTINAGDCLINPAFSGTIDDLLIFATTAPIDGPGGTLAQAGPCVTRTDNGLPAVGIVIIDETDATGFNSQLTDIVIHEMGHVMGIGTLWQTTNLLVGAGTDNPIFLGSQAFNEYFSLGGFGPTPVENQFGPGSRDGHWRESVFGDELMTSKIRAGAYTPLSRLSIASLADIGYSVNLAAADSYQLPGGGGPILPFGGHADIEMKEKLFYPIGRIN
jgi:hypothetical protein